MNKYTITLSDGTMLTDLTLNGNNFISRTEVTATTFNGKLSHVTISDGETEETMTNAELVQISTLIPDEWWFILREIPEDELRYIRIEAEVDYIAMMSDVEL